MAKVLGALHALGPKPIETLEPSEARKQYSATDAVKKVIEDEKLDVDPHNARLRRHDESIRSILKQGRDGRAFSARCNGLSVRDVSAMSEQIADLQEYDPTADAVARASLRIAAFWRVAGGGQIAVRSAFG